MMNGPKVGYFIPEVLNEFYLNRWGFMQLPMAFKKLGADIVIFAPGSTLPENENIPKIVTIGKYTKDTALNPITQFNFALQLSRKIKEADIDVMLFRSDSVAAIFIKMLNPKLRIVIEIGIEESSYDEFPHPKSLAWLSLLAKYTIADLLTIPTRQGYDMTLRFAPFLRKKLKVIREGVSETYFLKEGEGKNRKKTILCVARIVEIKSQDLLIRAFARIHNKHRDWRLRFVGPILDKRYYNRLVNLAHRLQIWNRELFSGFLSESEIRKEYLNASIFCLCSTKEHPGAVRCEAMAMGLPVVTTRTCGWEFVDNIGIVVPIDDVNALAEGLDRFMSSSEERRIASSKGRQYTRQMKATTIAKELISAIGDTTK
jgi:glycosyltransferase involved in cell wall biosynthesis